MSNPVVKMRSQKPYLFRAFREWITDSNCTPYVLVETDWPGVVVPKDYIRNGQIVLSIKPESVVNYKTNEKGVYFSATFSGSEYSIELPWPSIRAIYAKENEQGMAFPIEDEDFADDKSSPSEGDKGHLRVVK